MHITETFGDWDSPKGDLSHFVRMSQDHTCYNMSVISVEVHGITDINGNADIYCPTSGKKLGKLLLQQTLMQSFGALPTFIHEILRWSIDLAMVLEVPQCTWDYDPS